jgi:hypothetical protein
MRWQEQKNGEEFGVVSETKETPIPTVRKFDPAQFYQRRQRFSLSLLLFVVIVGLPIIGVPSLRNRLSTRVLAMKGALAGDRKPSMVVVGANKEPIPAEYQRPEPVVPKPPVIPNPERVFTMDSPITRPGGSVKITIVPRARKLEIPAAGKIALAEQADSDAAAGPSEESEVKYQRGKAEQSAYDLLLKESPAVAEMVQGKNPALKFKSWDAASRGEDVYWVRLKFQSEGNAESEYIWIVKLQSNQVSPLNFNARSIS